MAIVTKQNVATVAGQAIAKTPVLQLVNSQLDKEFGNASGDTVYARVNGYGTVKEGETDFTAGELAIDQAKVPVTVGRIATAAQVSTVDNAIKLDNFKTDVAEPRGANLAETVNQKVVAAGLAGATQSLVVGFDGTNGIQKINYAALSYGIAAMRQAKMEGSFGGILPAMMTAAITGSSASNGFTPAEKFANIAFEGQLGRFNQTDFVEVETGVLTTGTAVAAAASITIAEPVNDLPYSVATITAGNFDNIAVGTVMYLAAGAAPLYACNAFGVATGNRFTMKYLGTIDATHIKVTPVYFSGANKNVACSAALTSATALTTSAAMTASKTYYQGLLFNKNDLLWCAKAVMPMQSNEKASANVVIPGIPLTMSIVPADQGRSEIVRWDFLGGAKSLRGIATVGVYSQAAA